jgi:hypothetical protein
MPTKPAAGEDAQKGSKKKVFRNVRYFTFAVPPKIHSLTL